MRCILIGIEIILLTLGWGCDLGKSHKHTASDGYEEQKQEGVKSHRQNIQRLITRDPAQDPRK